MVRQFVQCAIILLLGVIGIFQKGSGEEGVSKDSFLLLRNKFFIWFLKNPVLEKVVVFCYLRPQKKPVITRGLAGLLLGLFETNVLADIDDYIEGL